MRRRLFCFQLARRSANSQAPHKDGPATAPSLSLDAPLERSRKLEAKKVTGIRKSFAAAAIAGSMLVGGVAGAMIYGATVITAAAATPSPSPSSAASSGTFVPNEDPTHEAGESAAREAQANAGQGPTVPE